MTRVYDVRVYHNSGVEEMEYHSDEETATVLKAIKKWLFNRYKRYTKLGYGYGVRFEDIDYAEVESNGEYYELNTFWWKYNFELQESKNAEERRSAK